MHKIIKLVLIGVFFTSLATLARAEQLPAPEAKVLLTISGNIQNHNADDASSGIDSLQLDMAMLEALGVSAFVTKTPWTEGDTEFEGVLLSKILDFAGAGSSNVLLTGLDGYAAELKNLDFDRYPIIIAYKRDGKLMTIRNLGPLWLMFPFDQFPELLNETNKSRAVWQLVEMAVR